MDNSKAPPWWLALGLSAAVGAAGYMGGRWQDSEQKRRDATEALAHSNSTDISIIRAEMSGMRKELQLTREAMETLVKDFKDYQRVTR